MHELIHPASRPTPARARPGHRSRALYRQVASLTASLLPGVVFAAGLAELSTTPAFSWVAHPASWPFQLWVLSACGTAATAAGIADWVYHRAADVKVGPKERRAELLALCLGGLPLFVLMAMASVSADPGPYLVPVLAVTMATVVMICWDEFRFHVRRCQTFETILHRVLTLGHGAALLAWVHLVFVQGVPGV